MNLVTVTISLPDWPWWGWVLFACAIASAYGFFEGFARPLSSDLYLSLRRRLSRVLHRG